MAFKDRLPCGFDFVQGGVGVSIWSVFKISGSHQASLAISPSSPPIEHPGFFLLTRTSGGPNHSAGLMEEEGKVNRSADAVGQDPGVSSHIQRVGTRMLFKPVKDDFMAAEPREIGNFKTNPQMVAEIVAFKTELISRVLRRCFFPGLTIGSHHKDHQEIPVKPGGYRIECS